MFYSWTQTQVKYAINKVQAPAYFANTFDQYLKALQIKLY